MEHLGRRAVSTLVQVVVVGQRQQSFLVSDPEDNVVLRRREYLDMLVACGPGPV